jgi:hypothetical protein
MLRVRLNYLLATIALLAALPCLFAALTPGPSMRETWIVLAVSGSLAAVLLGLEARRDGYAFAQFSLVAILFPGTFAVAAVSVAETDAGRTRAIAAIVVCAAGIAAAVAKLWKDHHARDEAPNVLLQRFSRAEIFEIDGVQWIAVRGPAGVEEGSWLEILVQSCVDAERTVSITLEDAAGLLKRRGSLATPSIDAIHLGPGEVGALRVPVLPGAKPARDAYLYVSVRARGPGGRRVRVFRARAAPERTRLGFQLFALLGGHIVGDEGLRFAFHNPSEIAGAAAPPRATWGPIAAGD